MKNENRKGKMKEFSKFVRSVNEENSLEWVLDYDTKTIELMDCFENSKLPFLVLERQYILEKNCGYVSLIITRYSSEILCERSRPTMTELKNSAFTEIKQNTEYTGRSKALLEKIREVDTTRKLRSGSIVVFEVPFLIGCQNSSNRRDYGCI